MSNLEIKDGGTCSAPDRAGRDNISRRPGEGRVRTAREFKVWEGGGGDDVARGLRRCFGIRTAVCTAFVDNDIGRLLEDFGRQGGVDTEFVKWVPFDGVGRAARNGLNFTERGFGVQDGAVGIANRGHTAASQLKKGDFDWGRIFGSAGTRFRISGPVEIALIWVRALWPRSAIPTAPRTPEAPFREVQPVAPPPGPPVERNRHKLRVPPLGGREDPPATSRCHCPQKRCRPPLSSPKQRRSPRAAFVKSPPPSQTLNSRAVRTRPSLCPAAT